MKWLISKKIHVGLESNFIISKALWLRGVHDHKSVYMSTSMQKCAMEHALSILLIVTSQAILSCNTLCIYTHIPSWSYHRAAVDHSHQLGCLASVTSHTHQVQLSLTLKPRSDPLYRLSQVHYYQVQPSWCHDHLNLQPGGAAAAAPLSEEWLLASWIKGYTVKNSY